MAIHSTGQSHTKDLQQGLVAEAKVLHTTVIQKSLPHLIKMDLKQMRSRCFKLSDRRKIAKKSCFDSFHRGFSRMNGG